TPTRSCRSPAPRAVCSSSPGPSATPAGPRPPTSPSASHRAAGVACEDGGVAARRAARRRGPRKYKRSGTELEFARFANLSDGVFAIAMTLLVVTIGEPAVNDARISHELQGLLPQMAAFFL